jgi:hypothetical protein
MSWQGNGATPIEDTSMRSIPRILIALVVPTALAVSGVALSSYDSPALAAKAKPSKAAARTGQANQANRAPARSSAVEPQQCTVQQPCRIYNFY